MNRSSCFWENDILPSYTDFTILGAGIVGISTALEIRALHPNANIQILDQLPFGAGASSRNAGFACFGSPTELLSDLQSMPEEQVLEIIQMRLTGLELLQKRCDEEKINFKNWGGYECFLPDQHALFSSTSEKLFHLNQLLEKHFNLEQCFQETDLRSTEMKVYPKGFFNRFEGQLHPGKMMQLLESLCRKQAIALHRGVKVEAIEFGSTIHLHLGQHYPSIKTGNLAICTNGFTDSLLDLPDCKPARAQVIMTSPIPDLKLKGTYHLDEGFYYFRNVGNRVLFGGGRNLDIEGETTSERAFNPTIQHRLESMLKTTLLPDNEFEVEYRWSGTMAVGKSKVPLIQKPKPNVVIGVRLGGMGVAIGSYLGKQIADLLH